MKLKKWLSYERVWTRKEIFEILFFNSLTLGIAGLVVCFFSLLIKPHEKNGRWKKSIGGNIR